MGWTGLDITRWSATRRGFGVVFQRYALFPNLTVAQNVAFGLENQSVDQIQDCVHEMLSLLGLSGCAQHYPAQLSGAQQQRVALARALAPRPRLLLLDEPLSALEAPVRTELHSEICRLQRELDIACVMVTNDQEEALPWRTAWCGCTRDVSSKSAPPSSCMRGLPAISRRALRDGRIFFLLPRMSGTG